MKIVVFVLGYIGVLSGTAVMLKYVPNCWRLAAGPG